MLWATEHELTTGMFLFLLQMERLKEDLEGTKREMASDSSSLPAALLPGTAGNIQPPPPIHYQRLFRETSHQLLHAQGVLASHHLREEWVFPLLPLASNSGEPVHLDCFHGDRLQRRF